jgi:hypothetical protein
VDNDSSNKITDRLRAEGSLIRNTGTNSIKSVRTDLAKFDSLFQSINSNIIEQTQILRNSLKIQIDEEKIRKSAKELLRADRTVAEKSKEKVGSTSSPKFTSDQQASGFLASLAGLFGGAAVGIGGSLLAALKTPLRTALFTVLAPAVGTLLGNITEEALLNIGADPGTALKFGEAANLAGMWGMIGLAFGKRAGVVGAVAGVAASFGDEVLDAVGLDKNKMVTLFGQEMKLETVAKGIMGALGASMATAVTSPLFMTSLGSFFKDTVGPDGEVISRFARRRALIGGTIATAVLGAYITYGDDVKNWLSEQGMPEDFANIVVDTTSYAAQGASIGMMFGPQGAIIGAIAGIAISALLTLRDYLDERANEISKKALEKYNNSLDVMIDNGAAQQDVLDAMTAKKQAELAANNIRDSEIREERLRAISASDAKLRAGMEIAGSQEAPGAGLVSRELGSIKAEEQFSAGGTKIDVLTKALRSLVQSDISNEMAASLDREGLKYIIETSLAEVFRNNPELRTDMTTQNSVVENILKDYQFSKGSKGFQDFGAGSFAVLHGREAVIPEQTPAGQFLKSYFDENWEPRLASKLNQASGAAVAMGGTTTVIYAPTTVAPITSVNNGGNSSSTMVVSGVGGRADLDARSIPYGAQ